MLAKTLTNSVKTYLEALPGVKVECVIVLSKEVSVLNLSETAEYLG